MSNKKTITVTCVSPEDMMIFDDAKRKFVPVKVRKTTDAD